MENRDIKVDPAKEEVGKVDLEAEVENGDTKTGPTKETKEGVQNGDLKAEGEKNGGKKIEPTEGVENETSKTGEMGEDDTKNDPINVVDKETSKIRETSKDKTKMDLTVAVENGDPKGEAVENGGSKTEGDTKTDSAKGVENCAIKVEIASLKDEEDTEAVVEKEDTSSKEAAVASIEVDNINTKPEQSKETAQSQADKEKFEAAVQELLKWFKENPNLPAEIELLLLKRFLKSVFGNIEDAKKLITLHYSLRTKNPHLFIDRDPEEEGVKKSSASRDLVALPGLTPDGHKVFFFRLADYDPKLVDSISEIKHFYMLSDSRFTVSDSETHNDEDHIVAEGDVQVMDMTGYSWAHATRASFMTMRVHMKYMQEAYPMRLHASHMINCPAFMDRMMSWFRPFIKDELLKIMHFHRDLESLYEHVPRDMLPDEYGGKAGKVADLKERTSRLLNEKREYLMNPKYWKVEQPTRSRWSWF